MFKKYFFKVLNFLPLFKKGALACVIEGLARYFDVIKADIIYTRNQFLPQTADTALLTSFGETRGITRGRFDDDDEFRRRVTYAYKWQLLGGKVQGLERIVADYGFALGEVKNMRELDPAKWAEFDLVYPNKTLFEEKYSNLVSLINQYKPARSRLRGVIIPYPVEGVYYIGGKARVPAPIALAGTADDKKPYWRDVKGSYFIGGKVRLSPAIKFAGTADDKRPHWREKGYHLFYSGIPRLLMTLICKVDDEKKVHWRKAGFHVGFGGAVRINPIISAAL